MSYNHREIVSMYMDKVQKVKAGSMGRVGMITREIAMMRRSIGDTTPMEVNKSHVIRVSDRIVKRIRKEVA